MIIIIMIIKIIIVPSSSLVIDSYSACAVCSVAVISARSFRGTRLHTRNRHLRNHRGFPGAFPNGCSVVFSNGISLFSGRFKRIVTCPVYVYWKCPMDCQWYFPMDVHFCDFWCVICCPDPWRSRTRRPRGGR